MYRAGKLDKLTTRLTCASLSASRRSNGSLQLRGSCASSASAFTAMSATTWSALRPAATTCSASASACSCADTAAASPASEDATAAQPLHQAGVHVQHDAPTQSGVVTQALLDMLLCLPSSADATPRDGSPAPVQRRPRQIVELGAAQRTVELHGLRRVGVSSRVVRAQRGHLRDRRLPAGRCRGQHARRLQVPQQLLHNLQKGRRGHILKFENTSIGGVLGCAPVAASELRMLIKSGVCNVALQPLNVQDYLCVHKR